MRILCAVVVAASCVPGVSMAAGERDLQVSAPAPTPQTPGVPGQPPPGPATAQAPVPPAPPVPRTFTAPVGLLFNTVRADRVADFEKVIAYVQAALEKSTDPTIRAQATGWGIFKATEPGPNSTVMYVFGFNPTVAGADYSLGRILADAYPDATQLQEIWTLYQGSVTSGGSLLNLTPVAPVPPPPLATTTPAPGAAAPVPAPTTPAPRPPLPDGDPLRRP